MSNTTDLTKPAGLRMCKQMNVPEVCRGALTHWPQLISAIRELNRSDPLLLVRADIDAARLGGPEQLTGALAIDPSFLHRPAEPADIYARFTWLTLRVYEQARLVQHTLGSLPALLEAESGNRAAAGALVREALSGPDGLAEEARILAARADEFALHLRGLGAAVERIEVREMAAGSTVESVPAFASIEGNLSHGMGAYALARSTERGQQQWQAQQRLAAARLTVLSVIGNMALAVQSLSVAWQITAAQCEDVSKREPRELGNIDLLHTDLRSDQAAQEWRAFADTIRTFAERTLTPMGSVTGVHAGD